MNDGVQLDLLCNQFPKFRDEYEQWPTKPTGEPGHFYLGKRPFGGTDALVAYCMVRHFQPRLIIEVGSGYSSLVLAEAAAKTNTCALICVEPFPSDFLCKGFPSVKALVTKKVEEIELDFFHSSNPWTFFLSISSHTVKIGGDVNCLFLQVAAASQARRYYTCSRHLFALRVPARLGDG